MTTKAETARDTLNSEIKNDNDTLKRTTEEKNDREKKKIALERTISETKQIMNAYNQAYEKIKKDKEDIGHYIASCKERIEPLINEDKKKAIEDAKKPFEEAITEKKKALKKEESKIKKYEPVYDNPFNKAKDDYDKKQKVYTETKLFQTTIVDKLKELKELKDAIGKERDKNKIANEYVLFKELEEQYRKTEKIMTSEEFSNKLDEVWDDLHKAEGEMENAEKDKINVQSENEKIQKELESLEKGKRKDILVETTKIL